MTWLLLEPLLTCLAGPPGVPQIPFHNVSNAYATRAAATRNTVLVEACLQVTMFLEDGSLMPRMERESFRCVVGLMRWVLMDNSSHFLCECLGTQP